MSRDPVLRDFIGVNSYKTILFQRDGNIHEWSVPSATTLPGGPSFFRVLPTVHYADPACDQAVKENRRSKLGGFREFAVKGDTMSPPVSSSTAWISNLFV
jgi:hypothetical protein